MDKDQLKAKLQPFIQDCERDNRALDDVCILEGMEGEPADTFVVGVTAMRRFEEASFTSMSMTVRISGIAPLMNVHWDRRANSNAPARPEALIQLGALRHHCSAASASASDTSNP